MNCLGEFDRPLDADPDAPILWLLSLYIEALGLFPNIEREGRQQLAILKGNIQCT